MHQEKKTHRYWSIKRLQRLIAMELANRLEEAKICKDIQDDSASCRVHRDKRIEILGTLWQMELQVPCGGMPRLEKLVVLIHCLELRDIWVSLNVSVSTPTVPAGKLICSAVIFIHALTAVIQLMCRKSETAHIISPIVHTFIPAWTQSYSSYCSNYVFIKLCTAVSNIY